MFDMVCCVSIKNNTDISRLNTVINYEILKHALKETISSSSLNVESDSMTKT